MWQMIQLQKLLLIEARTFIKNSLTFFFSFIFPLFLMVVVMLTSGNPQITDHYLLINRYIVISFILGLTPLTLMTFSVSIAAEQEFGILERLKLFKIRMIDILIAKILMNVLAMCLQLIVITAFAFFFFDFVFPPPHVLLVFLICYFLVAFNLFLIAWLIAMIFKSIAQVQVIGMTLMFIMLALSGAFGDLGALPDILEHVRFFIPTYDLSATITSYWLGEPVSVIPIIIKYIVANVLLIGLMFLNRNFRRR